jgi:chromosome segregation ATPase
MEQVQLQLAGFVNPILVGIVAFFLLRLVKTLDELHKERSKHDTELQLFRKDLENIKEQVAILRRDQTSIWRKTDDLKDTLTSIKEDIYNECNDN